MSIVFGLGIELETTFNFTDKNRVSRNMNVREFPENLRTDRSYWNKRDKWTNNKSDSSYFQLHGDSTVDGNPQGGGGFEFQIYDSQSLNHPVKEMTDLMFEAVNDGAKLVKSTQPYVIQSPFGTPVGSNTSQSVGKMGSYHLNVTMPYDTEKVRNEEYVENYRKKLFRGIKVVRVLEPLFVAMTGGADLKSVGTPSRAEGSGRQAYLDYGNLGNVDLNETFRKAIFVEDYENWRSSQPDPAGRKFKYGNTSPDFKKEIALTVDDGTVVRGRVGDVVVKQYSNVNSKIRTIEFRFLDPFFIPNFYEVTKVMIAALEHGDNVGDITDAKSNEHWNTASARIVEEGWNARLSKEYQTLIKEKLNLDIKVKDNKRADLVFQEVVTALWNKNKNGFWVKNMLDEYTEPIVMNLNRYNWDMQFRHRYVNETSFASYINKFIATLKKLDTSSSDGWVKVTFDSTGKIVVRDLIADDESFGNQMVAEDYEDILFLLERVGAVKLKVNDSGLIEALKVTNMSAKEIMKKIDNLQTIEGVEESYFGREITELDTREQERTEARTQERTTEATRTRAVRAEREFIPQEGTIDNTLLVINRVTPEEDSSLFYNVRDLKEIFNAASFLDENNQQFRIQIVPASIRYDGSARLTFWKRDGINVTIFINSSNFDEEEDMSSIVARMKNNFYSSNSVSRTNLFTNNLTIDQFFARLVTTAQNNYSKNGMTKISLDKAGLETLREYGVRIVSLSRGKNYFITDKLKYASLRKRFGDKLQLIKYMPYQKGIFVTKSGNTFNLIMNDKPIDTIRRN